MRRTIRYSTLDHWRGLAALGVLVFHASYPWITRPAPDGWIWFAQLAGEGWRGVHLFFVISGFCIAQLVVRETQGRRNIPALLRDRFLRVFPCYWAACIATAGIGLAALPFNQGRWFADGQLPGVLPSSGRAALSHLLLLEPLVGIPNYLLVAWSLSWEILYYVLASSLAFIAIHFSPRLAIGLGILIAFAGCVPWLVASFPPLGGWSEFTCGACVCSAVLARQEGRASKFWIGIIMALGATALLSAHGSTQVPLAAAFALLLLLLHPHDAMLAHLPAGRFLAVCGTMSYSLYLIHAPVAGALRNLMARWFPSDQSWFVMVIGAAVGAGLLAGWVFYRAVEAPIERWRRALGSPRS